MNQLTLTTWNALNAFGNPNAMTGAVEAVLSTDADAIYLAEMTLRGDAANDTFAAAKEQLHAEGYEYMVISEYSDPKRFPATRNAHTMGMFVREGVSTEAPTSQFVGRRAVTQLSVSGMNLRLNGIHLNDLDEFMRRSTVDPLLQQHDEDVAADPSFAEVFGGDFNAMYRSDPNSRLPRLAGKVIAGIDLQDPYSNQTLRQKVERVASFAVRPARMANGGTMDEFVKRGFKDADEPDIRPTRSIGPLGMAIDHIVASAGIELTDFSAVDFSHHPQKRADGSPLSDHAMLSAVVRRS